MVVCESVTARLIFLLLLQAHPAKKSYYLYYYRTLTSFFRL